MATMDYSLNLPSRGVPSILAMSGEYVSSLCSVTGTTLVGNGVLYFVPIILNKYTAITEVAVNVSVAGTSGTSIVRLGIYYEDNNLPSALMIDAGTAPTDVTGKASKAVAITLAPGRYWLAAVQQGAPVTAATFTTFTAITGAVPATAINGVCTCRYGTGVTGALPATAPALAAADGVPGIRVLLKIA